MIRLNRWGSCLWAVASFGCAMMSRADGFRNPPDTAAALGKAGKHMVWVDDSSAIFYNPANLVDVRARELQLSTMLGYSHADYNGKWGPTQTERPWGVLPAFSSAWHVPETDFALGLGMHVPYGRQTLWDSSGPFPIFSKMSVMDFASSAALRISESLSVGAGLDVYYGRLQFRQFLPFPAPFPLGRLEADADGFAVGGNVGITWRITPRQRLALTARAPFDIKFKGNLQADNMLPPPFLPPSVAESDLNTNFKFPTIIALGYGLQLTETLRVEANVEWLQFSRYKTMVINAGANSALAGALGLANAPQNWDDTWTFGLGGEWCFAPEWTLRAGYLYLQSPTPNSTFAPLALDVNQSVVSMGVGYKHNQHGIDLAYALGLFETRRGTNPANGGYYVGDYEFQGHLVALSYTYSF